MTPTYSNTFNLTHNKNKSEIVLNFLHLYTSHQFSSANGALTDVSGQVVEEVASVLINREGAMAIMKLLQNVVDLDEE